MESLQPGSGPQSRTRQFLADLAVGNDKAGDQLFSLVYDELRGLAAAYLRNERLNHTLQPTALVHEVYVRLLGSGDTSWSGRAHFLAVAAKAMRNTLVNHALAKKAVKRGGEARQVLLSTSIISSRQEDIDTNVLNEALNSLATLDPRKARVVEMRFFGGMTVEEIAHVLDVSISTVEADWRMARAWLSSELTNE